MLTRAIILSSSMPACFQVKTYRGDCCHTNPPLSVVVPTTYLTNSSNVGIIPSRASVRNLFLMYRSICLRFGWILRSGFSLASLSRKAETSLSKGSLTTRKVVPVLKNFRLSLPNRGGNFFPAARWHCSVLMWLSLSKCTAHVPDAISKQDPEMRQMQPISIKTLQLFWLFWFMTHLPSYSLLHNSLQLPTTLETLALYD